jgi:hypothetical protein
MNINYEYISKAIAFYTKNRYKYVDVPWNVTKDIIMMTKPQIDSPDYHLPINDKYLIASGEQGFLYSIMKGYLAPGRYVTCTPCYRFETQDWLHRKTFMKVELIEFSFDVSTDFTANEVEEHAYRFFHTLLPLSKVSPIVPAESDKGPLDIVTPMDWTLNGVEIGSYGVRQYKNLVKWVYGTGLAEPRFTTAKNYDAPR